MPLAADNVHLKVLVPSIAAGAIIGKGGETITQVQKDSGANIKMSKANDYYPGSIYYMYIFKLFDITVDTICIYTICRFFLC